MSLDNLAPRTARILGAVPRVRNAGGLVYLRDGR